VASPHYQETLRNNDFVDPPDGAETLGVEGYNDNYPDSIESIGSSVSSGGMLENDLDKLMEP